MMMNIITRNKQNAVDVPLITEMADSACLMSDASRFGSV